MTENKHYQPVLVCTGELPKEHLAGLEKQGFRPVYAPDALVNTLKNFPVGEYAGDLSRDIVKAAKEARCVRMVLPTNIPALLVDMAYCYGDDFTILVPYKHKHTIKFQEC